jgi:hypothetical protein
MHTGTRRYMRFKVENMAINAQTLFTAEVELLNISVSGACIKTTRSLKGTEKLLIRLEREAPYLTLPCSVVWEDLFGYEEESTGKSVPIYKTGVSFVNLSTDKVVRLKDFIRKSGIPYEQKVSDFYTGGSLRFTLHANRKAVIYYTKTFSVKKISLGGMLAGLSGEIRRENVFPMGLFISSDDPPIRFRGRIASLIPLPDSKSGRFDAGIEFLDMTRTDKVKLSKFLLFSGISPEK